MFLKTTGLNCFVSFYYLSGFNVEVFPSLPLAYELKADFKMRLIVCLALDGTKRLFGMVMR